MVVAHMIELGFETRLRGMDDKLASEAQFCKEWLNSVQRLRPHCLNQWTRTHYS